MPPVHIRKRPLGTEGFEFTGTNAHEIVGWAEGHAYVAEGRLFIMTDRGDVEAEPTNWVIRGLVGEFYPCLAESFEAGWEIVGEGH